MYNILLEKLQKQLDQTDYNLARDYLDYYAIEPEEIHHYIDEFISVCYIYNEQTGEHEQRMPNELPFADVEYLPDGLVKYSYYGTSVTRLEK